MLAVVGCMGAGGPMHPRSETAEAVYQGCFADTQAENEGPGVEITPDLLILGDRATAPKYILMLPRPSLSLNLRVLCTFQGRSRSTGP